ncbi:MAG: Oxygen regulatory protein NreC [Gemmatimonadota bacterium]|jgi:DNA-binding NarL/FixJ family response regulator
MIPKHLPRLVIADDHRFILDAMSLLISSVATVVGTATDGDDLIHLVQHTQPDLVMTDLSMPGRNGIEATRFLRTLPNPPRVIVLTVHADPVIARAAFDAGALGFVVKSADAQELRLAIETVMRGQRFCSPSIPLNEQEGTDASPAAMLTEREREILTMVANGLTAKAICERLGIAERTVNFHKKNLKARLGVATTAEAVAWLSRQAPQGV